MISKAGKTILIKNVAQSIPSYCMLCFLISKSLCDKIERMLNAYWWNSDWSNSKEIRCLS